MIRDAAHAAWSRNPGQVVLAVLGTVAAVPVIWALTVVWIVAGTPR